MLWNSFHSYRIKSFAYVVISKWGRYWLKCTWHNNQLFYFLLPYTCSSVAPPDLPHFTLESSQMLFNHIHYKQALFFSFNRKKDQRFVMNPYCWYYVAFQVYYLIYAVALSTLVKSCPSSWQSLIKYVIHMSISWCGVVTSLCTNCVHHFVPDADVSDYIMFFFLLLCKVVHNQIVQFRYRASCLDRLYAMWF